jgi:hypothetical protein
MRSSNAPTADAEACYLDRIYGTVKQRRARKHWAIEPRHNVVEKPESHADRHLSAPAVMPIMNVCRPGEHLGWSGRVQSTPLLAEVRVACLRWSIGALLAPL